MDSAKNFSDIGTGSDLMEKLIQGYLLQDVAEFRLLYLDGKGKNETRKAADKLHFIAGKIFEFLMAYDEKRAPRPEEVTAWIKNTIVASNLPLDAQEWAARIVEREFQKLLIRAVLSKPAESYDGLATTHYAGSNGPAYTYQAQTREKLRGIIDKEMK